MYVVPNVAAGVVNTNKNCLLGECMPLLTGDAHTLYTSVHGDGRYGRYDEKDEHSYHGGYPRTMTEVKTEPSLPFYHRAEHDAGSIFWTMLVALLRIKPVSAPSEKRASGALFHAWDVLRSQSVSLKASYFFWFDLEAWKSIFLPEMEDIGELLETMSMHVSPEYAQWKGELEPDHLHEAMQRLILQYLADHRDRPIPVDPFDLRPTGAELVVTSPDTTIAATQAIDTPHMRGFDSERPNSAHPSTGEGASDMQPYGARSCSSESSDAVIAMPMCAECAQRKETLVASGSTRKCAASLRCAGSSCQHERIEDTSAGTLIVRLGCRSEADRDERRTILYYYE